jgi:hypothetical protein
MKTSRPFPLRLIALGEWLMILPAALLLTTAALRMLQPAQYEPAHTSWLIFNWTATHISRLGAGILFLGMPAVVAIAGSIALLSRWRADQDLRNDATVTILIFRRRGAIILLMAATMLAVTVLVLAVAHVIAE